MANHASASKRHRQTVKRTARKRPQRSALNTELKKARIALESEDPAEAKDKVRSAARALARAVSKGILHKNAAARTTSRITHRLNKLG